jgi:hypothetical protein
MGLLLPAKMHVGTFRSSRSEIVALGNRPLVSAYGTLWARNKQNISVSAKLGGFTEFMF